MQLIRLVCESKMVSLDLRSYGNIEVLKAVDYDTIDEALEPPEGLI
jgi:hypothetical protein